MASGPSMLEIDLSIVEQSGWRTMAVNNTHQLAPWADVMYAGDMAWWQQYGQATAGFQGEKWTRDEQAARLFRLHHVRRVDGTGLCRDRGCVNSGGNSGYQAVNLAWHFGARSIILLGFDMHRNTSGHWHGEHPRGMLSAPASHIAKWRHNFTALAADLARSRCKVINATPGSALDCFPRKTLEEALC